MFRRNGNTPLVELSTETVMRLRKEDLERAYQLVMKRIDQYDRSNNDDPDYRKHLVSQSNVLLNEMVRRRWLIA